MKPKLRKHFERSVQVGQKKAQKLGSKTEKGFEKYFLQRISRLPNVGRFVFSWVALTVLLIGGLIGQNILLSDYYQKVRAVPGGIYREGTIGTFTNANPVYATTDVDMSVSKLIFSGLLTYSQTGQLVGDLAENYTINDHDTTYTVKLRPNLKWHDGKPLTSADVVFTYQTIQNPDIQSPLRLSWQGVKVSAPDAQTVVFKLPNPLASFSYNLTTGIIPAHILKNVAPAQFRSTEFNTIEPIGAGPFMWRAIEVAESEKDSVQQQIALSGFKDYHSGPPKLQEFVINTYTDKDKMVDDFKDKQLNAVAGLDDIPKQLKKDKHVQEHSILLRAATMVFFKTTSGVLADQKVRSALVQASDTQKLIGGLGYDTKPVVEPFLSGHSTFDARFAQAKFDLKAAQDALAASGWLPGKDGIRERNGQKLSFGLMVQNTPEYKYVSHFLKDQWHKVGVEVNLSLLAPAEFQLNLSSHNYESVLYGISIGVDPDVFVYWDSTQADVRSTYRMNLSEYQNKAADTALQAGRSRTDPLLRKVKYQPFLQAWQRDVPALALYQPRYLYLTNGYVDGLPTGSIVGPIDRLENVHNWQIRQAKVTNN